MPSISTHVLNSENGTHVAGLTVTLTYIEPDGGRKKIFSNKTDTGGRLVQNFDFFLQAMKFLRLNLNYRIFIIKSIYNNDIIFRVSLSSENEKFLIPIIVSQHGVSTWWSGE